MVGKLEDYRLLKGTITCETGLRIGGSQESIEIGGMENPIIRHPITDEPYIPGSSLKGKVRSLLELKHGRVSSNGEPCGCGKCPVCRVFGPHKNPHHKLGPTRILVRDAALTDDSKKWLKKAQEDRGLFYAEIKTENLVNRLTGTAEHPRTIERVPAGTVFDFEIAVRLFEDDDEDQIMSLIKEGLDLLQQDYLGGSGSRGYGKVRLEYQVI
jgi:CRISPR-associated protein Csm3